MIRVIKKRDLKIIIDLFAKIRRFNKDEIKSIYYNMGINKIVVGNVEDDVITSLLIANLINNEYYLEDFIFLNNDLNEIRDLLVFMKHELYLDQKGLSIRYTNTPYSETMHQMLLDEKFKSDFVHYVKEPDEITELLGHNYLINEYTDEVMSYINSKYEMEYNLISKEFGNVREEDFDITKTNVVVARNERNEIVGFLRFGLINDSIYISNIYGESVYAIKDLINFVRNITDRRIEVGIYPVREDLINILIELGFIKKYQDYVYKF